MVHQLAAAHLVGIDWLAPQGAKIDLASRELELKGNKVVDLPRARSILAPWGANHSELQFFLY